MARPAGLLVVALLLGTFTFAGLGLLMAGALRAEATLALANGLFIAFLLLGGIILPISELPGPLQAIAAVLPAAALADAFRIALGSGADAGPPVRDPGDLGCGRVCPRGPHLPLGVGLRTVAGCSAGSPAASGPLCRSLPDGSAERA